MLVRFLFSFVYSFAITWTVWIVLHDSIAVRPELKLTTTNSLYLGFYGVWVFACLLATSPNLHTVKYYCCCRFNNPKPSNPPAPDYANLISNPDDYRFGAK